MNKKTHDVIVFEDNARLAELLGPQNTYLTYVSQKLNVALTSRGNEIIIEAPKQTRALVRRILEALYQHVSQKLVLNEAEIDAIIRMDGHFSQADNSSEKITTALKTILPRSPLQHEYIHALRTCDLVFGVGPAGTGKTYLAVAMGISYLLSGKVDRLILTRPAVEAGERLGFLPGDLKEKVDPYLRPIYDALYDMIPAKDINARLLNGDIEIAPLAFMRGRTLANSYIILDEAQNTTPLQMKMFLTRLGENAKMVITGDITQIDLVEKQESGLIDAIKKLRNLKEAKIIMLTEGDIVRHPLVAKIVRAYAHE